MAQTKAQQKYYKSDKGKAYKSDYMKIWRQSSKGKQTARRSGKKWRESLRGGDARRQYRHSEAGIKAHTKNHLARTYGMSIEEYNMRYTNQSGCCAICQKHQTELNHVLCVDHDHATGIIRGLLCKKCNLAIAFAEDNVDILRRMIRYLNRQERTRE